MEIYQLLDLSIKLSSALIAGVGAYALFWRYKQEKNRNIYEKRLNEFMPPYMVIWLDKRPKEN